MLKRDKGTNLFATNKPPAQLFSPRGRRKVAHSELFSYLCATQAPGRGAARAHSSVGQSSGLIIRRSWDHAPLGPPDKPEHPEGCPGFCFARQGRGCRPPAPRRPPAGNSSRPHDTPAGNPSLPHDTSAGNSPSPARHSNFSLPHDKARRELLPPARHVRRSPPLPHDTSAGNSPSPARHTNFSLPHDKAPATPDSADAAEGRFTASFCRFTDRADSPLPEQPCSIWDFSYLCTLPSHEPHFSSP